MPIFVTLPSGLIVNLALVRRVSTTGGHGGPTTVHFGSDDTTLLDAEDASALMKRMRSTSAVPSNVKTMIFWLVILVATLFVWLTVRR